MPLYSLHLILPLMQLVRITLQYLYPRSRPGRWFFVTTVGNFMKGKSMNYTTPEGQSIVISRIKDEGSIGDFIALSDVCPHLGCKVYWESQNTSFFCPCHNGRFDFMGKPLEGPPKQADQNLIGFPLKIDKGLLYVQLSSESLVRISKLRHSHENCTRAWS